MKLIEAVSSINKPGQLRDLELGRILRKAQQNSKLGESFVHYLLLLVDESDNEMLKKTIKNAAKNTDVGEKEVPSHYAKKDNKNESPYKNESMNEGDPNWESYYDSAKGLQIDKKRVEQELKKHSILPGSREYRQIWNDLGNKPKYDAQKVLLVSK